MTKKRSLLTTIVVALLIIIVVFTIIPIPSNATTADAEVTMGVVTADYMNVRDAPYTNSKSRLVGILKKGTLVDIIDSTTSDDKVYSDWFKINYYGEIAYVAADYIDYANVGELDIVENHSVTVENCRGMTTASKLNLRFQPTTESSKITSIEKYSYVDVLEIIYTSDPENRIWLKVKYNSIFGYLSQNYVKLLKKDSVNTSDLVGIAIDSVRLRTHPTTNSQIKEMVYFKDCVTILDSVTTCDEYEKWYKILSPSGNVGWVVDDYLQIGKWTLSSTARTWSSSDRKRNHNIALACSYINGQILIPTEQFSWFESVLGSCSAEKGFLPATIYVDGKHDTGAGGGVCQVSTTINMAIKKLEIETQVCKHSLPVRYASKEDEATVSYPNKNFSFINTLQQPIMLEMVATSASCTCNVYVLQEV